MAYFRTTTNKFGAKSTKLVLTAQDKAKQRQRSLDRAGVPAWRMFLKNTRTNWHIQALHDDSVWCEAYQDKLEHLAAYRARYFANLAYKHRGIVPPTYFKIGDGTSPNGFIANYHYDTALDLDSWAIDHTITEIRYIERVARLYRINLESDHA